MNTQKNKRKIIDNGQHAEEVLATLRPKINDEESLQRIKHKAKQILEKSVDPTAGPQDLPSDGLLYGLIQSGKTSIIQAAAAMAADNDFQCLLILTSDNNPLYDQTLSRMRSALRGLQVLGKNDWQDPRRFESYLHNPPFVIVCSKNGSKLSGLLEAFKQAGVRDISALIIDDEADQASLNTYTSKGTDQVSKINEVITELRNFFRVNTYVQVTATPQALFLQTPDHRYRPSFSILSEPGSGYVGGDAFFGDFDKDQHKLLRFVDIHEVDALKTTHQPEPTGIIPQGLKEALFAFIVGATAKIIEGSDKSYAFLCHVSMNTRDHKHIVTLIDRFKEDTMRALRKENARQYDKLIENIEYAYKDLSSTQESLPQLDKIVEKIKFYLSGTNVKLINAASSEEVKLDAAYNIFVGGNKLGRGVTIENLLVSYYGRNPKKPNADTVLQHARMYGYRKNDIGVTRLFLPEKLAEHFSLIHQMENALRDIVNKYPEGNFEILYISSPLQATRRNVLDPNSLEAYVAGESINPGYPLRTPEVKAYTDWLDDRLKLIGDNDNGIETTINELLELLRHCPKDPTVGGELWNMRTIESALETIQQLIGEKAYLVIRRGRSASATRRERQGILSGGEDKLALKDAPTLFLYRQNPNNKGEEAAWWPQLRFPEGNKNYVLSFSTAGN